MRTLDETKKLLNDYKEELKSCQDNIYVIKGDNMTLNRTSYNKYELTKSDHPNYFNKDLAKDKLRVYKPKYELIKLEMILYKTWLTAEIKKLEKLVDSNDIPVTETYMEDFLHIDHPELVKEKPVIEEEEEEEEIKCKQISFNKLTNFECGMCNNCLVCKYNIGLEVKGSDIVVVNCSLQEN